MPREDKVWTDILESYNAIQFLFQFGFKFDDNITQILYGRTSQIIRDAENMLMSRYRDSMGQKISQQDPAISVISWEDENNRKDGRKPRSIWRYNHYQKNKQQWIPLVYGSYGIGYNQEVVKEKEEEAKTEIKDLVLCKTWTKEGFDSDFPYDNFLEMIAFFAEFAPLSVLGFHFLRRLNAPLTSKNFFVRRPFPYDGLEQESIYRCLYAILHHRMVIIDKKEYYPVRLIYENKSFDLDKSELYLEAKTSGSQKSDNESSMGKKDIPMCRLYLSGGRKIQVGSKAAAEIRTVIYYSIKGKTEYLQERYRKNVWNDFKISEDKEKAVSSDKKLNSAYYDFNKAEWVQTKITYCILKEDIEAFETFVESFGDFALMENKEQNSIKGEDTFKEEDTSLCNLHNSQRYLELAREKAEKEAKENGLCSDSLLCTPPTPEELAWLKFIIEKYPNFVCVFLEEKDKATVLQKISIEEGRRGRIPDLFNPLYYDWKSRWCDLGESVFSNKYRAVREIIDRREIIYYTPHGEKSPIIPYAMEYNVIRHYQKPLDDPIIVMAYDLTQKRDIAVRIKDIQCVQGLKRYESCQNAEMKDTDEPYSFSFADKVFHVIAYVVRFYMEMDADKKEIIKELAQQPIGFYTMETLNGLDKKFSKDDIRLIKGMFLFLQSIIKRKSIPQSFRVLNKIADESLEKYKTWIQGKDFGKKSLAADELMKMEKIFLYYEDKKDDLGIAEKEYSFYHILHGLFCKIILNVSEKEGNFELITDSDIRRLLDGEALGGIQNEITYFDEVLKYEICSFCLEQAPKEEMKKRIQQLYETFSGYTCRGHLINGYFEFSIYYERFNYRDVHMRIMMLHNWINFDSITPFRDWRVLNQREFYRNVIHTKQKELTKQKQLLLFQVVNKEKLEKVKNILKDSLGERKEVRIHYYAGQGNENHYAVLAQGDFSTIKKNGHGRTSVIWNRIYKEIARSSENIKSSDEIRDEMKKWILEDSISPEEEKNRFNRFFDAEEYLRK